MSRLNRGRRQGKERTAAKSKRIRAGLSALSKQRSNGALTPEENSIRDEILAGLIADKGREQQTSTAMRILAEVIASDAVWLVAFTKRPMRCWKNPEGAQQSESFVRVGQL